MIREWLIQTPTDFRPLIVSLISELTVQKKGILCLQGDLGAGKTTFTQILGAYLGVSEQIVSPTFMVMKNYQTTHTKFEQLNHIDAYRIQSTSELIPLRVSELLVAENQLTCIEWPELIKASIPPSAVWLSFEILPEEVRRVTITLGKEQ